MVPPGNIFVTLALYLFPLLAINIYMKLPAQRAVIRIFIISILFLPVAAVKFPLIPPYGKYTAASYIVLIATMIYDSGRFSTFQFSMLDVPMLLWCVVSPFMSSMSNGLGPQDAISATMGQCITWGAPYFIGRLYLGNLEGVKNLAIGTFVGAVIYIPFCWFEARTFASLHMTVYGMGTGRDAAQSFRYGGYRPQVFMDHGLMLSFWLMAGCVAGFALWRQKLIKKLWNRPMGFWVSILLITFIAARSTGAYVYFLVGAGSLFLAWRFRTRILLWALIGAICWFLYTGAMGTFPNKPIIATLSSMFNPDRVASLAFRFDNEEILGAKARQQMLFGWGGFGRNRIFNEMGEDVAVTDSLWIITFGVNGVFGLVTMTAAMLLPSIAFMLRYPASLWKNPYFSQAAAIAAILILFMLDSLMNAMYNPFYMLAAGGLAGVVAQPKEVTEAQMRKPVRQLVRSSVPQG